MPWHLRMLLYIFPFLLAGYFYIGWRFSQGLQYLLQLPGRSTGIAIAVLVILLNLLPVVILVSYLTGQLSPHYLNGSRVGWPDYFLFFPFWIGLIIVVELLPYFITLDIAGLVVKWTGFMGKPNWQKWKAIFQVALAAFFVVYVGIRAYHDTYRVKTTSYDITLKESANPITDLKIVLVGDVQVDRYTQSQKLDRFIEAYRKSGADLLLFSGDLVTSGPKFISQGVQLFCGLQAPAGKVAVLGDHDYWADPQRISEGLQHCGWLFLKNEHHIISYKGHKILITGLTNIYSKRLQRQQLEEILKHAPAADLKILLVHQPSEYVSSMAEKYGYRLMLAGHTHGGQLVFHPYGIPFTTSQLETKYYSGLFRLKNISVAVTNGIGLTLAPLRYGAPAEITRVVINPKQARN